jgi:hypothetical protein
MSTIVYGTNPKEKMVSIPMKHQNLVRGKAFFGKKEAEAK